MGIAIGSFLLVAGFVSLADPYVGLLIAASTLACFAVVVFVYWATSRVVAGKSVTEIWAMRDAEGRARRAARLAKRTSGWRNVRWVRV